MFTILETWRPDPLAWQQRVQYRLCTSLGELDTYLQDVTPDRPPSCDFETTGLNVYDHGFHAVGLSVARAPGDAIYVPLRHLIHPELNLPEQAVLDRLTRLDAQGIPTLWYNYYYDGQVLDHYGRTLQHWEDARLGVWLMDNNQKVTGLKYTAKRLLNIQMETFEETMAKGEAVPHFGHLDPTVAYTYACADADLPLRLWRLPGVQEAITEQRYIYTLEKLIVPIVWRGVRHGLYLDGARLTAIHDELDARIKAQQAEVYRVVDEAYAQRLRDIALVPDETERARLLAWLGPEPGAWNLASTPQIARMLTVVCGVPIEERTETNQPATGAEVLARYADTYPVCAAITKMREYTALQTNYVEKLQAWVARNGSLVRFAFNTTGAPTGRMSSGGSGENEGVAPFNVQSTPEPEKNPDKPNLRNAFWANDPTVPEAEREWVLVSIDFSQIEMRVAGNLSREPEWIKAFNEGIDIHVANARLAFGDPTISKDDKEKRAKGKTMGFAVLFQAGETTVAKHGGIAVEAARTLIETFFRNTRALKAWMDGCKGRARAEGKISTAFGRIRYLRDYYVKGASRAMEEQGGREAVNTPVQGTAADLLKLAIVKVDRLIEARGWQQDVLQVLWVHDEINFRVRRAMQAEVIPALLEAMQFEVGGTNGHPKWPIPLVADATYGWNWGELQKWKGEPL